MKRKPDDDGGRDVVWSMPAWMEEYRRFLDARAGGNSIERLMNLSGDQTRGNFILAGLCIGASQEVALLTALRHAGKLR